MKSKKIIIFSFALLLISSLLFIGKTFLGFKKTKRKAYDLTIVGNVLFADGIGRQAILLLDTLREDLAINFKSVNKENFEDVPSDLIAHIKKGTNERTGKVAIYEMPLDNKKNLEKIPHKSFIKIAYSMLESSTIPDDWVDILNHQFDAIIVPDPFLIAVYKGSGVKRPIFFIPLGLFLDDFFQKPIKEKAKKPFVFGNLSAMRDRKNVLLLVEAFHKAFGNRSDIKLSLNSRYCSKVYDPMPIVKRIEELGLENVEITWGSLGWKEYIEKMASFDCYVNPSKGEGFSISPRESLALGIPTIVTNNTAQKTLCDSGFVREVSADIIEPAYFEDLGKYCGCMFNCSVDDLSDALKDVYEHYDDHLKLATQGREWIKRYRFENFKKQYLNLIKPRRIELGKEDKITDDGLITSSEELYVKYLKIINNYYTKN